MKYPAVATTKLKAFGIRHEIRDPEITLPMMKNAG